MTGTGVTAGAVGGRVGDTGIPSIGGKPGISDNYLIKHP